MDCINNFRDSASTFLFILNDPLDHVLLFRCAFLQGTDKGEGNFSFFQILADGLAEFFFLCDIIKGIVGYLKGRAEPHAEPCQRLNLRFRGVSQNASHGTGGRDEDGGFFLYDSEVFSLGYIDITALHQLKNLPFGHRVCRCGKEFDDGKIAVFRH